MNRFVELLTLMLLATLLAACSPSAPEAPRRGAQAVKVLVAPIELSKERMRVEAVGTAQALQSIALFPAVAGEVVNVAFRAGEFVPAGAVLVELDHRDEALAVELAEVRQREADSVYQRYLRSAKTGATLPTTLEAALATLEAARIDLGRARLALEDRTIKAPFAGFVGITEIDVGDRVRPDTVIATLDDRSGLLVSFELPELLVGRVQRGDEVLINTWDMRSTAAQGEIIQLGSRINPETRTFVVRARVDNSDDQLRPGMSFRVKLDLEGLPYPVMSEIALQWGAEGAFVWAVEDGKAVQVPVSIIQRQQGQVLVKSGKSGMLEPGRLVVVEGLQRLRPGIAVAPDTAIAQDRIKPEANTEQRKQG
jgi:membrane fusion protein (multidrug efflux system)